jgi:hypothetical protein
MNWLHIDPDLPALAAAFDGNAMAQHFAQRWPWLTVTPGPRGDVHYLPATRCTVTYPLQLIEADASRQQTIGVAEATPAGLTYRLYTEDPQLPGVKAVARGALMDQLAPTLVRGLVKPIRYKPGARCTFRYDLQTSAGLQIGFGKVLAHGASHLWQTVSALYQASVQQADLPRIAQPLYHNAPLELVVQAAAPGFELHTAAFDSRWAVCDRIDWLRAAGRSMAALHSTTGIAGPPRTLLADLNELNEYAPALYQGNPALADRWREAIQALRALSRDQLEDAPVLSHGALRTDQLLIELNEDKGRQAARPALIDLDGVCWANPARDLGNLLAYLTWKALRQPDHAALIHQLKRAFLEGYAQVRPLPGGEWLACYQAASLFKIIGRRYSGLTVREWPLTAPLLDLALAMINAPADTKSQVALPA